MRTQVAFRDARRAAATALFMLAALCPIPIPAFEIIKVDDVLSESDGSSYATFQSHNQKLVQNQYGIFMTYINIRESVKAGTKTWRLVRSLDGGKSWGVIYQSELPATAPTLETDEHGSVYLIHFDYTSANPATNGRFLRFDPEKAFRDPLIRTIPAGSSVKFVSYLDSVRKRIYYFSTWIAAQPTRPNFFALDFNGNVVLERQITSRGTVPLSPRDEPYHLEYPHLEMQGTDLFLAWTTNPVSGLPAHYRSIHYVYSHDGGAVWRSPGSGAPLSLPIAGDGTSGEALVSLPSEYGEGNWLSSFISKGGYLHFMYASQPQWVQHYMRFNPLTGARNLDNTTWRGATIELVQLDGFFASETNSGTPLFAVGQTDQTSRVAILKSSDDGSSWVDHAASTGGYHVYALSGNRRLTKTGHILGHFTNGKIGEPRSVRFFRAPAVDRSTDAFKDWAFFPLSPATDASPNGGYAYTIPLSVRHGGDTLANGYYSKLRLFENGVEIGPAHTYHDSIRTSGQGRFSHWYTTLYFSASDSSDPRTNGRSYSVAIPWTEVSGPFMYGRIDPATIQPEQGNAYWAYSPDLAFFGTVSDWPGGAQSKLRLYEDGVLLGPAHSMHSDIRSSGAGRYSHWLNWLYFSASDNTDPRTNGRNYTWAIEGSGATPCGMLNAMDAVPESGYAYVIARTFGITPDSSTNGTASPMRVFENGVELGPAHTAHQGIRDQGAGRFSHWLNSGSGEEWLYFSSSDNTDPRTNGRIYTWGSSGACPAT